MSNGILSQLPSSHLFIHRVLAKLSNRVMPYGVNYRKLQLLFVICFLLTLCFCKVRFPADTYPASLNQPFRYDPLSMDLGHWVPFQNPAQFQKVLILSRILEYYFSFTSYAAWLSCLDPRRMSFNIFRGSYLIPFFRIVKIILRSLQAIAINDCIFFNGFCALVV